jgi:hypothetical protein
VCALFCKEFLFLLGLGKLTKLVFTKKKGKKERKKEEDKLTLELVGGPNKPSYLLTPPLKVSST